MPPPALDIEPINKVLREEGPARLLLQAYDPRRRALTVAFTFDGGPREDDAFVVVFDGAVIFHVPSVLHREVLFALLPPSAARKYVPAVSFDDEEFGPAGFRIVAILDEGEAETGYYVAAEGCTAEWLPTAQCPFAW
jgi:hypothetical protein